MGEYAKYNGQDIKIGTCESMYYLRADQAHKVQAVRGSVNPIKDCASIRFRFPFPDEDGTEPGAFENYDRGLGVWGVECPEEIDHYNLQFSRTYPHSGGILLSTPCPESKEGKASGLKFGYNGYSGKVQIVQQRVWDGKLVLVCACGSCGAAYRLPTLEEAQPIIEALLKECESFDRDAKIHETKSQGDYYREVVKRIVEGYQNPPAWVNFHLHAKAA